MTADDKQKAEALLRKRRLAAEGLLDKPEGHAADAAEEEASEESRAVGGAVTAAALRRSG